jgi:tetratricopeptide (TPR) repeat protein
MKQLARAVRELQKSGDAEAVKKARIEQLRFELSVFKDRVDRYPTDNRAKFELGVRRFQAGQFDDAIPLFQVARVDPKNRTASEAYLGRCFFRKGYHTQAINALKEAIKGHEFTDDELAKTMQYWLGRSQEAGGEAEDARTTYGNILRLDYNYLDVRARLDALSKN